MASGNDDKPKKETGGDEPKLAGSADLLGLDSSSNGVNGSLIGVDSVTDNIKK